MTRDNNGNKDTSVFRGRSMQDAINQLKLDLGPNAVIVGTTRGSDRQGRYVEITATRPIEPAQSQSKSSNPLVSAAYANTAKVTSPIATTAGAIPDGTGPFADRAKWLAEQVAARAGAALNPGTTKPVDELMALRNGPVPRQTTTPTPRVERYVDVQPEGPAPVDIDLASLRASVQLLSERISTMGGSGHEERGESRVSTMSDRLERIGVAREYAAQASKRAFVEVPEATCEDGDLLRSLESLVAEDMTEYQEQRETIASARIVAFIGATGIGKTTTIAKLATQAKLKGESVALITLDTIRLAAVDQLTRFSAVLNVPLTVVSRASDLVKAIDEFREYDRIFIDTAGKSPYNSKQVKSLHDFFPKGWGGEIVLTVSSTARQADLFQNLDAFSQLNPSGICVTKLDETSAVGAVYTAMRRGGLPIVWLTDGQRIPEDIRAFDACGFSTELMGRLRMMSSMNSVA
jgi:flagellar biosynthesis protein FlhF